MDAYNAFSISRVVKSHYITIMYTLLQSHIGGRKALEIDIVENQNGTNAIDLIPKGYSMYPLHIK